jgi:hypothetical protein
LLTGRLMSLSQSNIDLNLGLPVGEPYPVQVKDNIKDLSSTYKELFNLID